MGLLEDLENEWRRLVEEWEEEDYPSTMYKQLRKIDDKIIKMRLKILKLYIGDKSNAPNVPLYVLQEDAQDW